MAACKNQTNSCVFVGNIAYNASEAQVKEVCEEIGPVVSFKLMTDKNGKPKGFGFCEYLDEETALSALRNLNGVEVRGRTLKVKFADNGKNNGKQQDSNLSTNQDNDPLTLFFDKYTSDQLIEIVSEMNELAANNVQEAQRLLELCPGLPKAIIEAQLKLGIVPPHAIHVTKIMLGSNSSVPQSSTQFQILDHGQIQTTHNDSEFSAAINQHGCKRVFDSGHGNGGSDSISHPPKFLRLNEEKNRLASHQVDQVHLSAELLKVLLEKQMLRLPPEEPTPFDQQHQQWQEMHPGSAIPFLS